MITLTTLTFDLALLPVVMVGALAGAAALKRMPQSVFNTLVLALAAVAAIRMILV